ncbi:MAG: ABC transporter permease, partial [bacterium]
MNQFTMAFTPEKLEEAWRVFLTEFPMGLWETLYVTVLSTLFAIVLGLPLGILLVTGDEKGIRPMPGPLMKAINVIINFLR